MGAGCSLWAMGTCLWMLAACLWVLAYCLGCPWVLFGLSVGVINIVGWGAHLGFSWDRQRSWVGGLMPVGGGVIHGCGHHWGCVDVGVGVVDVSGVVVGVVMGVGIGRCVVVVVVVVEEFRGTFWSHSQNAQILLE